MTVQIWNIKDIPHRKEEACRWFSHKWGVPYSAYLESMNDSLKGNKPVPQWYLAMDGDRIIGGLGLIENDFHERPDLTPNVCAVYVEQAYRCRGIAGELLSRVCGDMKAKGIATLYLVTDHSSFYERYGWRFLCMVKEAGGEQETRMYVKESY